MRILENKAYTAYSKHENLEILIFGSQSNKYHYMFYLINIDLEQRKIYKNENISSSSIANLFIKIFALRH
jgi:hypothetical protein